MDTLPVSEGLLGHSDRPALSDGDQLPTSDQFVYVRAGEAQRCGHLGHSHQAGGRLPRWSHRTRAIVWREDRRPEPGAHVLELREQGRDVFRRDVAHCGQAAQQLGDPRLHDGVRHPYVPSTGGNAFGYSSSSSHMSSIVPAANGPPHSGHFRLVSLVTSYSATQFGQ